MNKLDGLSMDLEKTNIEKLKAIFPECFVEEKLDIDKLLSLCGEYIDNDFEKYKFEWSGKSDCLKIAQQRSKATLRPCKGESVDFDNTENLYIEGDNLEVLKLLQKSYYRKVKMMYIDPPYNTGNDFVYNDDFKDPIAKYKEVTSQTTKSNPETMGRYHTNWLNMMYPRLRLASNLLKDDGVIFISIDDNEVHNLRKLCDEVFGEENFVAQFVHVGNSSKNNAKNISITHEYAIIYAKNRASLNISQIKKNNVNEFVKRVNKLKKMSLSPKDLKNEISELTKYPRFYDFDHYTYCDDKGVFRANDLTAMSSKNYFDILHPITGEKCKLGRRGWAYNQESMKKLLEDDRVLFGQDENTVPQLKCYLHDTLVQTPKAVAFYDSQVDTKKLKNNGIYFDFTKSVQMLKTFIEMSTSGSDIILDFFSGSATTAHAVMELNAKDNGNRKYIMVQLPEVTDEKSEAYKAGYKNIYEIAKERIRRAGAKVLEENSDNENIESLDIGFKVFRLDSSSLYEWDNTPIPNNNIETLANRINSMIDNVKHDRSDLDMVYEIMLKMGVPLTYGVHALEINDKKAYSIGKDCLLLVCLDKNIKPEDINEMIDYSPAKIILSKNSFKDDTDMSNAYYILKDHEMEVNLI